MVCVFPHIFVHIYTWTKMCIYLHTHLVLSGNCNSLLAKEQHAGSRKEKSGSVFAHHVFHVCVLCCLEWPAEVIIWWSPLSRLSHRWKSQSSSACNVGKVDPLWWDVYALYLDVTQTVFIVRVKECTSSLFALAPHTWRCEPHRQHCYCYFYSGQL